MSIINSDAKKKTIFISLFVGLLVISIATTYLYTKRQEHLTRRYHLLCEVHKPNMSKEEVLHVLSQEGEFTAIGADSQDPVIELHTVFTDPIGKELYGAFDLGFSDYKYVAAYIRGFESSDIICDFSHQIKSATSTSNP